MGKYGKYLFYPVLYLVAGLQLTLHFIEQHTASWKETLVTWNKHLTKKVNS